MTLSRSVPVRGYVYDEFNRPVTNTVVQANGNSHWQEFADTRTDDAGVFRFEKVGEGEATFTVRPIDRAAEVRYFQVRGGMDEIVIRLKAPLAIRGHVRNDLNQPIAGAKVKLEPSSTRDATGLNNDAITDAEGQFQIEGAPRSGGYFRVSAAGYQARQVRLVPDHEDVVTLRRSRDFRGVVLEDATGQPLTNFVVRIGPGHWGEVEVNGSRHETFQSPDGRFSMSLEDESETAAAVVAFGFEDQTAQIPPEDTPELVFRMKRTRALKGVVLKPDGTPAPGIQLATASETSPRFRFRLDDRSLAAFGGGGLDVSDSQGRFEISSARDDQLILAVGKPGCARASVAEVRRTEIIQLQAWGRIEGTCISGGQPAEGREFLYEGYFPGLTPNFQKHRAASDADGRFTLEDIPPGTGKLVRMVPSGQGTWMHSDATDVMVEPGTTTYVTIGDAGAMVEGSIRLQVPPPSDEPVSISGVLTTDVAESRFSYSAEARAYFASAAGAEELRRHKRFAVVVETNGNWKVESVPPGRYALRLIASSKGPGLWAAPPVAKAELNVVVPENASMTSPIHVGEVLLTPAETQ